ncbi:rhamnogalacturonan acetylesterase [Sphingomonas donggukensis]|uniref:Rhamnogalacturonan acetylesterase n=1 Tax=Sphingomonas donggukensis TaxID=2949093 RepID=A0ABY4TX32_9SPHN|nr:rhamnogalacturonan acetylesterase [Sphingomonas donggukensis]URW76979.1 rhamnogalacturonan acetylesterase [Sphingomonas donggukensis]
MWAATLAQGAAGQTPVPPVQPIRATKIVLVGDSTVQANSGWGGAFCAYHVTSFAACVNLARGGRSTSNYRAEGSWALALAEMRTPGFAVTYVLIGFGHNDQPGKPGRSTDLATEFPANMERYVAEIRATGAIPVLFTPLTRRQFKDGRLDRDLDPWAAAIRAVGARTATPVIDLNRLSADAVQAMGPVAANHLAQLPPPPLVQVAAATGTTIAAPKTEVMVQPATTGPRWGDPKLSFDYTHLGRAGADYFATQMTTALGEGVPALRPLLIP